MAYENEREPSRNNLIPYFWLRALSPPWNFKVDCCKFQLCLVYSWQLSHNCRRCLSSTGNDKILLTERGTTFGYHNLVVDFRAIPIMQETGCPIIFDATHSVQLPAAQGVCSGGDRRMIPTLAAAAVAAGVNALFMEVHPDPVRALCDGANSLSLQQLKPLLRHLRQLWDSCQL